MAYNNGYETEEIGFGSEYSNKKPPEGIDVLAGVTITMIVKVQH